MVPAPALTAAPIIVTALFGERDFQFFDGLRRQYYPPERNVLPAHLTLFHHLPPSIEAELRQRLASEVRAPRPDARLAAPFSLGRGVALRIESPPLEDIRARLADAFGAILSPQDAAPWRPHVTIQNKVAPHEAAALLRQFQPEFIARPVTITGLASWWYRGGPWESLARYSFRG